MSNYKQISYGATGADVKTLQQLLASRGYTQVGSADGIFGQKTQAALRAYQADNALAVDGIAGPKTWASLTASQPTAEDAPVSTTYDPAENRAYQQAISDRDKLLAAPPKEENPWRAQAEALYSQLETRQPFSWDPATDLLYQTYRRQALHDGRLAMEDTLGRASTLTGGYASTYAQVAGQQTYGEYLRRLSDAMPDYYAQARQTYDAQTDALAQRYQAVLGLSEDSYDRYRDQVSDYENRLKALENQAETAYDQGYDQWQDAYKRLETLVKAGYTPTSAELSQAGMTAAQAAALAASTQKKSGSSGSSGGSSSSSSGVSKDKIRQIQKRLGLPETGTWDTQTQQLAHNKWGATTAAEAWQSMNSPAANTGYLNYESVTNELIRRLEAGATKADLRAALDGYLADKTLALGAYYTLLDRFDLA